MPADPKDALRASVRAAQERYEADIEAAREGRRDADTTRHSGGSTPARSCRGGP